MKNLLLVFALCLTALSTLAQTNCDDVIIESVTLEPIEEGLLVVHLINNNTEFGFGYPGFRIYDEDDNLIGEEMVNLFGIGQESSHLVPHNLENIETDQSYNLKLELWSGFYEVHECTFEGAFVIKPDECSEISLTASLQNFNGTFETHDMQIVDLEGEIVYEQEVTLTDTMGYVFETICLDPGCYSYQFVPQDGENSIEVSCWINSVEWFFPEGYIQSTQDVDFISIDFSIYQDCLIDFVEPDDALELLIYPNPARETVNVVGIPAGSSWALFSSEGLLVRSGSDTGRVEVDVEDLSSGLYIMKVNTGHSLHTHRIVR